MMETNSEIRIEFSHGTQGTADTEHRGRRPVGTVLFFVQLAPPSGARVRRIFSKKKHLMLKVKLHQAHGMQGAIQVFQVLSRKPLK